MTDLEILDQMIKEAAKVPLDDNYGKNKVILTEPQQADALATIFGVPDDAIVIKADAFRSPDTIFDGSHGECKRADFVIVADTGKKKVILCIELKTTKDSKKEITQQLSGTQCFVEYCREIGRVFWNERDFLDGYAYRFVSIGHTSIPKRKTRTIGQADAHDRPDKMMKIDWPNHLQFNHLSGGS
ncbi:MAG TPA: hypothetical protein ENK58_05175 [Desulfobacterales bacterium]|nr:MAG: hypothetical protein DRI57_11710 [Deltaproteobacteria bacterium]HHC24794.1 hypothetical protein [Desulfobacterales bacterium]